MLERHVAEATPISALYKRRHILRAIKGDMSAITQNFSCETSELPHWLLLEIKRRKVLQASAAVLLTSAFAPLLDACGGPVDLKVLFKEVLPTVKPKNWLVIPIIEQQEQSDFSNENIRKSVALAHDNLAHLSGNQLKSTATVLDISNVPSGSLANEKTIQQAGDAHAKQQGITGSFDESIYVVNTDVTETNARGDQQGNHAWIFMDQSFNQSESDSQNNARLAVALEHEQLHTEIGHAGRYLGNSYDFIVTDPSSGEYLPYGDGTSIMGSGTGLNSAERIELGIQNYDRVQALTTIGTHTFSLNNIEDLHGNGTQVIIIPRLRTGSMTSNGYYFVEFTRGNENVPAGVRIIYWNGTKDRKTPTVLVGEEYKAAGRDGDYILDDKIHGIKVVPGQNNTTDATVTIILS